MSVSLSENGGGQGRRKVVLFMKAGYNSVSHKRSSVCVNMLIFHPWYNMYFNNGQAKCLNASGASHLSGIDG